MESQHINFGCIQTLVSPKQGLFFSDQLEEATDVLLIREVEELRRHLTLKCAYTFLKKIPGPGQGGTVILSIIMRNKFTLIGYMLNANNTSEQISLIYIPGGRILLWLARLSAGATTKLPALIKLRT